VRVDRTFVTAPTPKPGDRGFALGLLRRLGMDPEGAVALALTVDVDSASIAVEYLGGSTVEREVSDAWKAHMVPIFDAFDIKRTRVRGATLRIAVDAAPTLDVSYLALEECSDATATEHNGWYTHGPWDELVTRYAS
jgi:hypothetical protein